MEQHNIVEDRVAIRGKRPQFINLLLNPSHTQLQDYPPKPLWHVTNKLIHDGMLLSTTLANNNVWSWYCGLTWLKIPWLQERERLMMPYLLARLKSIMIITIWNPLLFLISASNICKLSTDIKEGCAICKVKRYV